MDLLKITQMLEMTQQIRIVSRANVLGRSDDHYTAYHNRGIIVRRSIARPNRARSPKDTLDDIAILVLRKASRHVAHGVSIIVDVVVVVIVVVGTHIVETRANIPFYALSYL